MKTNFLLLVVTISCFSFTTTAQRGKQNTSSPTNPNAALVELNLKVYQNALTLNDLSTALYASHTLVALEQENFKDTLAYLYFYSNSPGQSIEVLLPLLKKEELGSRIALVWQSYYALQDYAKALIWLEKLPRTAETYAMIADCQMKLKREGEFQATLNQFAKASDELKETRIFVPGENKAVKAKSYIGHLLAYSLAMQNKNEEALQIYKDIAANDPEFETAKENAGVLQDILSTSAPASK